MKGILRMYFKEINRFCKKVIRNLDPKCIILYGSLARGDFNERSDVDLIVIASNLPENYYKRAELLSDLIISAVPIEPLGYTPDEFIKMIQTRHCTSLFAMTEGKPLYGKKYFAFLKKIYTEIADKYKLVKRESAWISQNLTAI
jgi:predicted nucleotidyltransferase